MINDMQLVTLLTFQCFNTVVWATGRAVCKQDQSLKTKTIELETKTTELETKIIFQNAVTYKFIIK